MKINFYLDKQNKPLSEKGMKVVYGKAKRGGYRLRWYLILTIVVSPLLFMAYYFLQTKVLVSAPGIITSYPLTITSTQSAVVGLISVKEGREVGEGESLIGLEYAPLDKEIEFLSKELETLANRSSQSTDSLYQSAINETRKNLSKVEEIQLKYDQFRKEGHISDVDYAAIVGVSNALNSQLSDQEIAHVKAMQALEQQVLAGPVSQQYRELKQQLVVKNAQKDALSFRSPFGGRVLDIHVYEGQRVTENSPLLTVSQNITPEVTAFLDPKFLKYSQLYTRATVVFPDGKKFSATVSRPVEVVNRLPQELQSPFKTQPANLKVTLSFDEPLEKNRWIEGVGVDVRF